MPATGNSASCLQIKEKCLKQTLGQSREMRLEYVLPSYFVCKWLVGQAAPADELAQD